MILAIFFCPSQHQENGATGSYLPRVQLEALDRGSLPSHRTSRPGRQDPRSTPPAPFQSSGQRGLLLTWELALLTRRRPSSQSARKTSHPLT